MARGFYHVYEKIIQLLRKGSTDYDGLVQMLTDQNVDLPDAKRLVQIAREQVEKEKKEGDE